jgi:hypothetical protein
MDKEFSWRIPCPFLYKSLGMNKEWIRNPPATHSQPHKQLLVGWIAGGIGPTRMRGGWR